MRSSSERIVRGCVMGLPRELRTIAPWAVFPAGGFGLDAARPRGNRYNARRMPGSSFGQAFRVTTAGESHGPGNVVIIDGCPPGIALSVEDLRVDLGRRRPGQSHIVTQRKEADEPEILAGGVEGRTTGPSIGILGRHEGQNGK